MIDDSEWIKITFLRAIYEAVMTGSLLLTDQRENVSTSAPGPRPASLIRPEALTPIRVSTKQQAAAAALITSENT